MSDIQKPDQTGVRPTLVVGLGGTGKQTLLQLRRMFLDAHGTPALPYVQSLMIDSDVRAVTLDDKEIDEFFQACQFVEEEKIETPLAAADLDRLQSHAQEYPHILSWFDPSLLTLPRPRDGNSQIRSFGRYAFITNYVKIRRRLEALRTKLEDQQLRTRAIRESGIELQTGQVDCWMIFSIAGGTGAGMFIDMAYLLKDVFAQKIRLHGVALMPDLFAPESATDQWVHRAFANGYASLMELENYNYQRDQNTDARFRVCWTRDLFQSNATCNPGVFEMTWLIGARSRSDAGTVLPRDKEDVTQAMAEWLFTQIGSRSGTLARSMNSRMSNWISPTNTPTTLKFTVGDSTIAMGASQAYGSFGLSKIFVPSTRIQAVNTHRLSADVARAWIQASDVSTASGAVEKEFAETLLLKPSDDGEIGQSLRKRLYSRDGSDLFTLLDEKFAQKRADFRNPAEGARKEIEKWLQRDIELALVNESEPNPEMRGDYVRLVDRTNYELVATALEKELDTVISAITRSPGRRIRYAEAVLKEVQRRYRDIAVEQRQLGQQRDEEIRLHRSHADRVLSWSDDHGGFERRACIEVALEQYCISLKSRLSRVSHIAAARLAERLATLIGQGEVRDQLGGAQTIVGQGLLKDLGDLEQNVGRFAKRLDDRLKAIESARRSTMNREIEPSDDKKRGTYKLSDGSAVDPNAIYAIEARMFSQANLGGDSPWQLRRALSGVGQNRLIDQMLAFAKRQLQDVTFDTFDVLAELDAAVGNDTGKRASEIRHLNEFAAARWAEPTGHTANKDNPAAKPENFLLIPSPATVDVAQRDEFLKELKSIISEDEPASVDGPKDSIYLVKHLLGQTLSEWPNLGSWRSAYERIIDSRVENRAASVLHTTLAIDQLPEILPPDTEEAGKLLAALKICAEAMAFGILTGEWETPNKIGILWSMKQKSAFGDDTKRFGRFASAVRQVRQNTERGSALIARVSAALASATPTERARAAAILKALTTNLNEDAVDAVAQKQREFTPAFAMKRSQPGWFEALKVAQSEIVEGKGKDKIEESLIDQTWEQRADWVAENPPGSGFYRQVPGGAPAS